VCRFRPPAGTRVLSGWVGGGLVTPDQNSGQTGEIEGSCVADPPPMWISHANFGFQLALAADRLARRRARARLRRSRFDPSRPRHPEATVVVVNSDRSALAQRCL
jgi:hypothetical protein